MPTVSRDSHSGDAFASPETAHKPANDEKAPKNEQPAPSSIAKLRKQGMSTRAIAEKIHVPQTTVVRDLKHSAEPNGSPETAQKPANDEKAPKNEQPAPSSIKGRDGKSYPPAHKPEPEEEAALTKDAEGHAIPPTCSEAFATLEKFEAIDTHVRQLQSLLSEVAILPGGEQLRMQLKPTASGDKTVHRSESLEELKRLVKFCRPHSVCPCCQGKALKLCRGCSGRGWVSSVTWKDFDDATKAKLGA